MYLYTVTILLCVSGVLSAPQPQLQRSQDFEEIVDNRIESLPKDQQDKGFGISGLTTGLTNSVGSLTSALGNTVSGAVTGVANLASGAVNTVGNTVSGVASTIGNVVSGAGDKVESLTSGGHKDDTQEKPSNPLSGLSSLTSAIGNTVSGVTSSLTNTIGNTISSATSAVGDITSGLTNTVGGLVNGVGSTIHGFSSPANMASYSTVIYMLFISLIIIRMY